MAETHRLTQAPLWAGDHGTGPGSFQSRTADCLRFPGKAAWHPANPALFPRFARRVWRFQMHPTLEVQFLRRFPLHATAELSESMPLAFPRCEQYPGSTAEPEDRNAKGSAATRAFPGRTIGDHPAGAGWAVLVKERRAPGLRRSVGAVHTL